MFYLQLTLRKCLPWCFELLVLIAAIYFIMKITHFQTFTLISYQILRRRRRSTNRLNLRRSRFCAVCRRNVKGCYCPRALKHRNKAKSITQRAVMGSILKYMYFKEYFKYMLSIFAVHFKYFCCICNMNCILNTFLHVFVF